MPFAAQAKRNARSIIINLTRYFTIKGVKKRQINIKYSTSNLILRPPLSLRVPNFNCGKKVVVVV